MSEQKFKIGYFLSLCIEQYKMHIGVSGTEVAKMFEKYGVLNYLYDNYEVLHTQGSNWLNAEQGETCPKPQKKRKFGQVSPINISIVSSKFVLMFPVFSNQQLC